MLERKNENVVIGNVEGLPARYHLLEDFSLYDDLSNKIVDKVKIGEMSFYELDVGVSRFLVKEAVIIQAAYTNSKLPFECLIAADVIFIDGNVTNVSPSNLIWDFSNQEVSFYDTPTASKLFFIPGYTRYGITPCGRVMNYKTRSFLSPYVDESGYWIYGVTPDVGKRTIVGMHRLLALAYLKYTRDVCRQDVNHIDGNKSNNDLRNLEWASRKRNCDHAYSTGLRTDNCEVLVRNAFTGFEKEYYSLEEAARQLGFDGETIRLRVQSDGQKVYAPGLQFKKKNSTTTWKIFEDHQNIVKRFIGLGRMYDLYDFEEVFIGRYTAQVMAEKLAMGLPAFRYHATRNIHNKKINGHIVRIPNYEHIAKSILGETQE